MTPSGRRNGRRGRRREDKPTTPSAAFCNAARPTSNSTAQWADSEGGDSTRARRHETHDAGYNPLPPKLSNSMRQAAGMMIWRAQTGRRAPAADHPRRLEDVARLTAARTSPVVGSGAMAGTVQRARLEPGGGRHAVYDAVFPGEEAARRMKVLAV
jgi:hypothetical protein